MNRRALMVVALIAVALIAAVVFLVREVKESPVVAGTKKTSPSRPVTPASSSPTKAVADDDKRQAEAGQGPRRPGPLPKSGAPIAEDGVIKTTDDGREYVEYTRADGTRVRDFRQSAKKRMEHRRGPRGPRLLAPENAAMVKRDARPKVWACMREHWETLTQLPGVDADNPVVVVFAKTSADSGTAQVGTIEVVVEGAERGDPGLARCIEDALAGLEVGLASGVEQKAYEDFELGMRFYLPKQGRKRNSP